ncbi:bifunctional (p)ppGpp synthetase/guanosine-3',5'-bis(diphosphate) 3'-pyrophosphohydrolase [Patescibacteria group bacterium]|nr:MAG: bifunctional (p)ppGpp synthetase/guanosine-3',5'-bis(diphosphate) 3'-pyrophosphohydrolase [Patescibacteria group bacterium]
MSQAEFKAELKRYQADDRKLIELADAVAATAHDGQLRKSGESYIEHPRQVALYLMEIGMDAQTVAAGLLHDVLEDTAVTEQQMSDQFGPTITSLVDGVTKLGTVRYTKIDQTTEQRQAASIENMRKLLLAMSKDMRVLMIKLADRRHNLQTLGYLPEAKQHRIAEESLTVYAPLADRLGMGALKAEMEDLAFEYANPVAFKLVQKLAAHHRVENREYIDELGQDVDALLRQHGIEAHSLSGRNKHLYSIYRKLTKTDGDITKIYDLTALRIIVPSITDCYQALGLLHQSYKPLIYRIKDYISVPKPNGYRSLHTTVFAKYGRIIEVQIRTPEMHQEAEYGLASHVLYDLHKQGEGYRQGEAAAKPNKKLSWIQDLASLSAQQTGSSDMMQDLKVDLFRDRIFVFSPMGDLYDLPEGATPVDFAFAVHTDVGLRTQGARVNHRIAPLDRPLENRDVVEIITRKQPAPNRQWLNFVKTTGARSRIKSWFKAASRDANIVTGRQLIEAQLGTWGLKRFDDIGKANINRACQDLNLHDADSLLAAVGDGSLSLASALRRLLSHLNHAQAPKSVVKQTTTSPIARPHVVGAPELPCSTAPCCNPEQPDAIVGYITRGKGVTVHRKGCQNIPNDDERLFECAWGRPGSMQVHLVEAELHLICQNRLGLVHDITGLISSRGINIVKIATYNEGKNEERSIIDVTVEVADLFSLSALIQELRLQNGVTSVEKQTVLN